MSACTFFGHRDCPEFIYPQLVYFIRELVLNNNVRHFYVGTQGNFDYLAYRALKELQDTFQEVIVFRVLAYKPRGNSIPDSMLPEGIEAIHPKYAIPWRNRWMISRSDYVITYVTRDYGGAAKFEKEAVLQGRNVIRIGQKYAE